MGAPSLEEEFGSNIPAKPLTAAEKKAATLDTSSQPATKKRVRIYLEDNPEIPPTGQFMSVNGRGYVLRAGEEADVPEEILSVLNDAVMSVPVMNGDTVVGYKDRLRFPYRVIARDVN